MFELEVNHLSALVNPDLLWLTEIVKLRDSFLEQSSLPSLDVILLVVEEEFLVVSSEVLRPSSCDVDDGQELLLRVVRCCYLWCAICS